MQIISLLLDAGADINFNTDSPASRPEEGYTPLMRALNENQPREAGITAWYQTRL